MHRFTSESSDSSYGLQRNHLEVVQPEFELMVRKSLIRCKNTYLAVKLQGLNTVQLSHLQVTSLLDVGQCTPCYSQSERAVVDGI
jgi:hypothetical protein